MATEWTKIDDQTICKYSKPEGIYRSMLTPRISLVFNFESRKVHSSITDVNIAKDIRVAKITTENFSDIESDAEIQTAYQKLIEQDGKPNPYSRDDSDKGKNKNSAIKLDRKRVTS